MRQTVVSGIVDTAEELSERLTTKQARLKELESTVRDRYRKKEFPGLLLIVDELLTLKPERADVRKLRAKLEKREAPMLKVRDNAIKQAAQQLSEQQYTEALATLNTVSEEVWNEQFEELKTKASDLLNHLNNLRERIAAAISDNQLLDLLPVVEQCLALKPDQDDLVKLEKDLIARQAQLDARNQPIISRIQAHMQQQQFDAALEMLGRITPQQQTSSTVELSQRVATEKAAQTAAEKSAILAGEPITNAIGMTFNQIPAGTFLMGSFADEPERGDDEALHHVTISKVFYMQTTEVTQGQWKAVMGTEPWKGKVYVKEGPDYAATYVSWNDAVAFCKQMSEKEGKTYRLPTEAEWECACRSGTETRWSFGDDEKELGDYAWYYENADNIGEKYAHQVGLKKPNAFGLYDMHGNVYEWCHDYYGEDYYKQSPTNDPQGPASGSSRVCRGGSWVRDTRLSRSAYRGWRDAVNRRNFDGFRLVRELN
jgi:formylglycine-generating enzyme required for sulfatase activity